MRKLTISIAIILLMLGGKAFANPRIIAMTLLDTRQQTAVGSPVGLSVIFSEPVYGFGPQDIITNGRVLAVEGDGASYRVVIVPNNSPLVVDVLADAARNIRGQGNDPSPQPLVLPLGQNPAVVPVVAPLNIQQRPTRRERRQARQQAATQPVAAQPRQEAPPVRTHFVLDVGLNAQGPAFFNVEDQTEARPGNTPELTLGFEIRHRPAAWRPGMGYRATLGYQQTLYNAGNEVEGRYTAIPLMLGFNFYFSDYVGLGFGAIAHFNGMYIHNGPFAFPNSPGSTGTLSKTLRITNGGNSFDSGLPGLFIDLTFVYKKVGFLLRYINLPLQGFADNIFLSDFDFGDNPTPTNRNFQTNFDIGTFGFFIEFRS